MPRSLIHHWRTNLAVVLAAAVATAVITGALLVGDSVRGSLRDLTLERLGAIDYSVTANRFFRQDLAESVNRSAAFQDRGYRAVPAALLRGAVSHAERGTRASEVQINGIGDSFGGLFQTEFDLERKPGQIFQSVVINEALGRELDAQPGDQILVHLQRSSAIHRESLMGSRDPADQIQTLRLQISQISPSRFSLFPNQSEPFNVFVRLDVLQRALDLQGRVNALLVAGSKAEPDASDLGPLQSGVRETLVLEHFGLSLTARGDNFATLQSDQFVLAPWMVDAALAATSELPLEALPTSTYLANSLKVGDREVPYSTMLALDPAEAAGSEALLLTDGSPAPRLRDDEILLNQWAAEDLKARPGDAVEVAYYAIGPREELRTETATFTLRGVTAMSGLGVDRALVPEFPGISEAEDMSSWRPPFPVDLAKIRPRDEAYWDQYRAAPKAFVTLETGRRLWSTRFGLITSIRLTPKDAASATIWKDFRGRLLERLPTQPAGFQLEPVKERGLAASSGPTDFSGLFVGFSFFLVFSATLIVGLLFRLSVERRANEIGLLLSVGFSRRAVLKRFLSEAVVLAAVGATVGLGGAVAYAGFLMFALRTWWVEAVGTTFLRLHVHPATMAIGWAIAFLVVVLFTTIAVRKLFRIPKPLLLAGETVLETRLQGTKRLSRAAWATSILAVGLFVFSLWSATGGGWSGSGAAAGFFATGACLLAAGLLFFALWCRGGERTSTPPGGAWAPLAMAARNAARNPGRSVLSVALVSSACFVIVAVGANRLQPQRGVLPKESGTGGFALVAQSETPILKDLSSRESLTDLGFSDDDADLVERARIYPLRLLPGDDASCLNLYRPEKPRVLGVPRDMVERGGFTVETSGPVSGNPWTLLENEMEPGVIPAFGDHESVQWILQLGLGQDVAMEDEFGKPLRLRLTGLIQDSIFQSELLISEENFLRHFPSQSGYAFFLIDAAQDRRDAVAAALENGLARFGFDATGADQRLARFHAVRSTYISTFQTLGGLGLLLGTLGLAIVLIRNVLERRGELATLRAFGFRRRFLAWMVAAENAFLLALGVALGTLAAAVAVVPNLVAAGASAPWGSLALTLLAVLAVGMLAGAAAVRVALRIPLLPALKAE